MCVCVYVCMPVCLSVLEAVTGNAMEKAGEERWAFLHPFELFPWIRNLLMSEYLVLCSPFWKEGEVRQAVLQRTAHSLFRFMWI